MIKSMNTPRGIFHEDKYYDEYLMFRALYVS